jgi:tetratricopeptide (TPR) repeat protein
VHVVYSQFLGANNRWEEALQEARIGLELDPLNPWFRIELAHRLAGSGQLDEAATRVEAVIASQPDFFYSYDILWMIEHQRERFGEALAAASRYFELIGEPEIAAVLAGTDANYVKLMHRAADLLENNPARPYVSNVDKARLRVHAGDYDRALDLLEEAFRRRESHLVYTIADPQYKPVREDERYQELRRKISTR